MRTFEANACNYAKHKTKLERDQHSHKRYN